MSNRRSFIRGFAAAPLAATMALPSAAMAVQTASDPIVAELAAQYAATARRLALTGEAADLASSRIISPAAPEALFLRPFDPLARCITPKHDIDGRRWFGSGDQIATLRAWNDDSVMGPMMAAALPRRVEVLAAYDDWQAATKAAEDAAGATAANAEYNAALEVEKAIRFRILDLRSDASDVLRLKLRVFTDSASFIDWREGLDASVSSGVEAEGGPWEDAFAASIVRDLATAYMAGAA